MSSILDALKKLEEEKARESDDPNAPLDRAIAAHELTGRGRGGFEITPLMLGAFVAATAVFVVGVAMGAAFLVVRAQGDRPAMAREMTVPVVAPSVPETPPEPLPVPETSPEPLPVPEAPERPLPVATSVVVKPAVPAPVPPAPTPSIPPDFMEEAEDPEEEEANMPPAPAPKPSVEEPPAPVYIREPAPPAPVVTPAPVTLPEEPDPPVRSSATPEDPRSLPYLSRSVQDRLGIPDLKVNMVSRASRNHPRPSALINYNRVYLDETIPETNARLVSITIHGIAIEVNGQQYFVPQR
jgi:hypothetical protein